MHSTDDGRTGYPRDASSLYFGSMLYGQEVSKAYPSLIVKLLAPHCPPRTRDVGVQTDQVAKEAWEEGTSIKHCRLQCRCYQGIPHCHVWTFHCFS